LAIEEVDEEIIQQLFEVSVEKLMITVLVEPELDA
jgi:hypothetical protein